MPSPDRTPYTIRELSEIHRAAQERLGLFAAVRTLDEWTGVNLAKPSTNGSWFTNLFSTIRTMRRLSKFLTFRFYNLNRALGGGRAYSNPDGSDTYSNQVPLSRLYQDLGDVLAEVTFATALPANPSDTPPGGSVPTPAGAPAVDEATATPGRADQITSRLDAIQDELVQQFRALEHDFLAVENVPVDEHQWSDPFVEDDFEKEYRDLLNAELDALDKEIRRLEQNLHENVDTTFESLPGDLRQGMLDLGEKKSYVVAGISDSAVTTAGRDAIQELGIGDRLVTGWMRVTGPHPCAFCAMLASRGPVYNSAESAGFYGLAHYHANCHCSVVPVFKTEPALSARDQFFVDSWKKVAKREPNALNVWRRWLTQAYKEGLVPDQDVYGPARPA